MARTYGVHSARIAILDNTEKVNKTAWGTFNTGVADGIFTADEKTSMGVTAGDITGLAPTSTRVYGSDMVVEVSQQGTGNVSVTLGVNDLPNEVIHAISGFKLTTEGFAILSADSKAPYSALEITSHNRAGQLLHFALVKGIFAPEPHNMKTNNESQQAVSDSLTFAAVNRSSDRAVYLEATEDSKWGANSAAWDKLIFPSAV